MSSKILMPALSPTMTEGIINQWLVKVGDIVKACLLYTSDAADEP